MLYQRITRNQEETTMKINADTMFLASILTRCISLKAENNNKHNNNSSYSGITWTNFNIKNYVFPL